MRTITTIAIIILVPIVAYTQAVEITGSAKISTMNEVTSATANVVRQADGTLAIRHYQIGDFAQGGIVFFVDESGEHGLVCAKEDQSANLRWFAGGLVPTQAKGDGPYAGEMNTAIAIASHAGTSDDGATYAARLCAELMVTEGGFTYGDWYLPAKEELNIVQQNSAVIDSTALANGGGVFAPFLHYWSSTESSFSHAWSQHITFGTQSTSTKSSAHRVRAIRAF
jgi:hypothetical protein